MRYYVGLDVSVKTTSVCIVDEAGKVVKERSLPTEPDLIAAWLDKTGLTFERVGHEAGPMSSWLHEELSKLGLAVVCVEARHMQTALAAMRNKTDRNADFACRNQQAFRRRARHRSDDAHRLVPAGAYQEHCRPGVAASAGGSPRPD